ncbi:MAG: MoaD/ThiS family protein [Myxococcota bacterium]
MKVILSGTLLRFVGYEREIEVEARTVGEAINAVEARHDALRNVLRDGSGAVRTTHQLFVNGEQVGRNGLERPVGRADVLEVLTAIAGG